MLDNNNNEIYVAPLCRDGVGKYYIGPVDPVGRPTGTLSASFQKWPPRGSVRVRTPPRDWYSRCSAGQHGGLRFVVWYLFLFDDVYDNLLFVCDCVYCRSVPNVAGVPLKWRCVSAALLLTLALYIHVQQLEFTARLDFIWKSQVCLRRLNRPITRLAWLASVYFLEYSIHCSGIQNSPIFRTLPVVVINVVIVITTNQTYIDFGQKSR